MRFRTKTRPRGLLKSSDQRRLTLLMLAVAVVLVSFSVVRRPAFWAGLFSESQDAVEHANPSAAVSVPTWSPEEVLAIKSDSPKLKSDEFLLSSNDAEPAANQTTRTAFKPAANADVAASASAGNKVRVKPELLKDVSDDVVGVHSVEAEAYYSALKMAQKYEQRKNLKAPKAAFALFMADPAAARGLPWFIEGRLRRLTAVRRGATMHGIGTMYEGWLTTADSGDRLVHVVATSVSPELERLVSKDRPERTIDFARDQPPYLEAPEVELIGYFFKREAYASGTTEGVSLAPMFVAGSLRLIPKPVTTVTRADDLTPYLIGLAVAVCIGLGAISYSFFQSDRDYSRTRAHQLTKLPAHASFDDVTAVSPAEALQDLQAEQQQQTV